MSSITPGDLGWWIIGIYATGTVLGWIQDWISDRYEITRRHPRLVRCWYGTAAQVSLRSAADDDDPDRFAVLARWDENTAVPWLLVHRLDREYLTYWDEDAEAFWAPVTDFAPYSVRRVRPHLTRFGRVRVPWLTKWLPARSPVSYLGDGA
jgi:hypothetical protein